LDAGLEQLQRGRKLIELGRDLVDRALLIRLDRADLVDWAAEHIDDASQRALADGHRDRRTSAGYLHAAAQAVGRSQRDAAHHAIAQLLLDFEGKALLGELVGR